MPALRAAGLDRGPLPVDERTSLLSFPCDFPIKIMGRAGQALDETVLAVVREHLDSNSEPRVSVRPSSRGSYVAVTITITALSQAQLDDIYRDLCAHEHVLMVL